MSTVRTLTLAIIIILITFPLPAQAVERESFSARHWTYQALSVLSESGLIKELPSNIKNLDRYEMALLVGDAVREIKAETDLKALLALSDLQSEFRTELSVLQIEGDKLATVQRSLPVPRAGSVVTGSTDSEGWDEDSEFGQRYNLIFDTTVTEGVRAQAEISGDFSDLFQQNASILPELPEYGSTPIELERVDLFVDQGPWYARLSNRLKTSLDKYTLYDQELAGAEAQMVIGNLGATVVVGQDLEDDLVTAINGQYQLHPNFQVGGTVVSQEGADNFRQTNYGVNSFLRLWPGLEIGGQYYIHDGQLKGGSALEVTAWTHLAGINLEAGFNQVDEDYYSPLVEISSDTYVPGSRSYDLNASTKLGKVDLGAQYAVHDYEYVDEQRVTKKVSAFVPVIPNRLDVDANYRLVDVDALYSPDYSTQTVSVGSKLKLTDEITLKAGYEVSQDSYSNSTQSLNADVAVSLNRNARLNADLYLSKEDGFQQSRTKEAGLELGYSINEYTELIANYRLIDFDSTLNQEDYRNNVTSAELKMDF